MTYLQEYREEIKSGNIVAGRELITMLDKLINDLDNPKYYYDTKEAYLRIDFIEKFIKLTKSPFYGKPMKLLLWQKAFIEVLYSFKRKETGFDRFKRVLLLIARKNAKSETCSALALTELMVGNPGADIVCSSNDDNQANILYDSINTMREMFDPKGKRTHKNLSHIINKKNGSKIFKLSDRTRNKEGRNIDFAIIDEKHEMKDNTIDNSIDQSQSLKDNPKKISITTEGFVNDGALDQDLKYARAVLNDEYEDDTLLVWLYTQDSEQEIYQDEKTWQKSNPSLGAIKKYDYLRERIHKSKFDKAEKMFTLAKDFNIKQNNVQAWLMEDDYNYECSFNIEDFRNAICLGAVDLSKTTDSSCAKVLLMKPGDNTKYIYTKYFIPESKLTDSDDKAAGAKYTEWAQAGLLDIHEGNEIDIAKIADWFYSLYKEYGIKLYKYGYDVKFSKDFLNRMDEYGFEGEIVIQNRFVMSNPMKLVEADLKSRLINYNNNEMDKWCFGNASMEIDNLGNVMCIKINNQHSKRIDGAITNIILFEIFRRYRTEFLSNI